MTATTDRLADARTVLLRSPGIGSPSDVCGDLLAAGGGRPAVLFVTYATGLDRCLDRLADVDPASVRVVAVGDAPDGRREGVAVERVSSPTDLTGLGVRTGNFIADHDDPVVCFDSITAMLQYVEPDIAFEFLHAVTGRATAADARAHFHVTPDAHDEQVLAAITSLFDASVTVGDGTTTVRTRDRLS